MWYVYTGVCVCVCVCVYTHTGILFSYQEEEFYIWDNIDEPGGHDATWNKLERKT